MAMRSVSRSISSSSSAAISLSNAFQSTNPAARDRPAPAKSATSPEQRARAYCLMKSDCSEVGFQAICTSSEAIPYRNSFFNPFVKIIADMVINVGTCTARRVIGFDDA